MLRALPFWAKVPTPTELDLAEYIGGAMLSVSKSLCTDDPQPLIPLCSSSPGNRLARLARALSWSIITTSTTVANVFYLEGNLACRCYSPSYCGCWLDLMASNINGTDTSSTASACLSPTWQPPKAPLPPHRLAKLANALGVSTPIPGRPSKPSTSSSFLSRSFSESAGPSENARRSPTPSIVSSLVGYDSRSPSTTRYLLHVIPPMHLPHDDNSYDSELTPAPSSASGYHTQFRRGTLVTVHSTLQAQLSAIAKEYALPSTAGMVLYLVSSGTTASPDSPISPRSKPPVLDGGEPGPRLSEEIWRHLWIRVLQAEQRETNMLSPPLSRSPTPLMLSASATRSNPFLPHENLRLPSPSPSYAPSPVSPRPSYPTLNRLNSPSPSTPSSVSDMRFNSKSAPPSSASAQSEPDTPDTSVDVHETASAIRSNSFDLPGLNSPSLIPILAKVEFDIDRRRAGWYDPWLRSRKVNHAKRAGSLASRKASIAEAESDIEAGGDKPKERVPAIPLLIGKKDNGDLLKSMNPKDSEGAGYEQMSDSDSDFDEDDLEFAEESTAKVSSIAHGKDPLEDVFGTDADTWDDLKDERRTTHEFNPNVVNLSLTGGELSVADDSYVTDGEHFAAREEEEVREMLEMMSQGAPTPDPYYSPTRKHVPPPLVLIPRPSSDDVISTEPSPLPNKGSTDLPYLNSSPDQQSDQDDKNVLQRSKTPTESEKRAGALFEDLDLGLDPSEEYDDNDPNDRRRSQYVMRAQLDEIERTLAQLSPRMLKSDLDDEMNQSFSSATLSPNSPAKLTLSPLRSSDLSHSPSRLPQHPNGLLTDPTEGASWPAVPFSLKKYASETEGDLNKSQNPPRLALNGVTTSAPRSLDPRNLNGETSSETLPRNQGLEGDQALYGQPPLNRQNPRPDPAVIPLSPDPFGRFASSTPEPPTIIAAQNASSWDTVTIGRSANGAPGDGVNRPMGRTRSGTSSRFSADSLLDEQAPVAAVAAKANRGTLMSVKSIKNLWRKSNKGDKEKEKDKYPPPPPTPTIASSGRQSPAPSKRSSGRVSPGVPSRPDRPQDNLDLPDVPAIPGASAFGRYSPSPQPGTRPSSRASQDSSRRPSQDISRGPPPPQDGRPSMDYSGMVQRRPSQESSHSVHQRAQESMAPPPVPQQMSGLSVPQYAGRNSASPIIPTQMLPGRQGGALDRLHFDQESPYPNPIRPVRQPTREPSPPRQQQYQGPLSNHQHPQQHPQQHQQQQQQQTHLPSIPERKSILKWKSSGPNQTQQQEYRSESRTSFDRMSMKSVRSGRNPSVASVSAGDLPSPPLHGNFSGAPPQGRQLEYRQPVKGFDVASPPQYHRPLGARSVSPSHSLASIDSTQFEVVSPRLNTGMPYPTSYHGGPE
ncbi:hypothetical protein FA15DRAFT_692946 [Coprinopsis marcescibilis]|uniref:Uncharacterized protein n=1 Tax=Coprinopsis marcescibilis TaxID=230819 RepID=A0A5C3L1I4_COPMA|nr:hypothetical protein FA15DRAFT_692946 [Coprinopsis marcescibilis]